MARSPLTQKASEGGGKPGFQGSETSSAEVFIYPQQEDPILKRAFRKYAFDGRSRSATNPSLVEVQTSKSLGQSAGTFSLMIKPPSESVRGSDLAFRDQFLDHDWADVVFTKHASRFHVERGLIKDIRRSQIVTGSGAATEVYNISGEGFGSIFKDTQVWFDIFSGENISSGASIKALAANSKDFFGNVSETVEGMLFGFLKELGDKGRNQWFLPEGLPRQAGVTFGDNAIFADNDYSNFPARTNVNAHFLDYQNNNLWAMAQHWSDPDFVELFTDLRFSSLSALQNQEELNEADSEMVTICRDRPFPTFTPKDGGSIRDSLWFDNFFPTFIVSPQEIVSKEVGRGGAERYNAFGFSPSLVSELSTNLVELGQILWYPDDINRHGLRRLDVQTKYTTKGAGDILDLAVKQRDRLRDWYALNPYYYNGMIQLGHGRPDIRIGSKLLIPGENGTDDQETYYIESVSHRWRFGQPIRTTLKVTRGWIGDDQSLISAMQKMTELFRPSNAAQTIASAGIGFA